MLRGGEGSLTTSFWKVPGATAEDATEELENDDDDEDQDHGAADDVQGLHDRSRCAPAEKGEQPRNQNLQDHDHGGNDDAGDQKILDPSQAEAHVHLLWLSCPKGLLTRLLVAGSLIPEQIVELGHGFLVLVIHLLDHEVAVGFQVFGHLGSLSQHLLLHSAY